MYGKKGSELTLEVVLQLIFVAAVLLFTIAMTNNALSDSRFHRDYFSSDLALLLEGVITAPGDIRMAYDAHTEFDLEFVIEPGEVSVYDYSTAPRERRIPISWVYATDNLVTIEAYEDRTNLVEINKTSNDIKFGDEIIE